MSPSGKLLQTAFYLFLFASFAFENHFGKILVNKNRHTIEKLFSVGVQIFLAQQILLFV
jgi:hypothetical protein